MQANQIIMNLKAITIIFSAVFCYSMANAQIRIAVLSDIHIMGPGLLVNPGAAWDKEMANNRKLLDYSCELFCQIVNRLIEQKPDILLITGDLTKDGEKISHLFVKEKLDGLRASGVKIYVIPGNHDIGHNSHALYYDGDHTSLAETISDSEFAELYQNYGYSKAKRDVHSLSYVCEPYPGLVLIGIDSHDGSLTSEVLDWICGETKYAHNEGKSIIAMMHHPLFPHINNAESFVKSATIDDYETVRNRLVDAGVRVIFTGHFHTSDIAKDWSSDLSKAIYDVNTGSLVSYPCDYRQILINNDLSKLSITTDHVRTLASQKNFLEIAKDRLYKNIYGQAYKKAHRYIHNERTCTLLAQVTAETFILHAEGNEGNKEKIQAVEKIDGTIEQFRQENKDNLMVDFMFSALEPSIKSVMTDTSNYGDPKRSNITDDHTLTISLK